MRQNKDGQPVSLFEVVELYHQPSCRIAFLHGAAQVGKIVNDEDFAPGLQSHLLYASHDGFLEIGFQQRIAVKRYPVQPFGKVYGRFHARWYSGAGTAFRTVQSPDTAHCQSGRYGRLSARQGWTCPHWNPQRGRTVPPHTRNCPRAHGAWAAAMLRVSSGWRS